jgi:CheY-like chemotaxis protein
MNKILVVDDEDLVVEEFVEFFVRKGLDVTAASNGIEALNLINNYDFTTIITDLRMPGMNGFDLIKKIRNDLKLETMIIVCTGYCSSVDTGVLNNLKVEEILKKPISLNQLLTLLP